MKNYLVFTFIALAGLVLGCNDILDINDDPLAATQADPDLLFPAVLVNLSNNRTIELSGRMGNVVQYYEPGLPVLGDMALGSLGNIFITGNTWRNYYGAGGGGLKDLVLIEQDAAAKSPPNDNVIAQSKIMQAFIYYLLTGIWERVPFTEAVNFDITQPAYDDQQTILRGVITLCDEAIGMIDNDPSVFRITRGDLIYNGDLDKWVKFANSLKLKSLLLLANKTTDVVSEISQLVGQPLITTLADEAAFKYYNIPGNYNPIWNTLNLLAGGVNANLAMASTTFMNVMNSLNDPRKSTYYDESVVPGSVGSGNFGPAAAPGSYGGTPSAPSIVSLKIIRRDFPDRYMTAAEILLMQAEVIAKGWASGSMADANMKYQAGILASMNFFDGKPGAITPTNKDAYLASLPDLASLSQAEALKAIHLQIYINNFLRMPDAWIEWKRTKVPDLVVPQGSLLSDILRRLFYPPDEKGANPNTPTDPPLDSPMWYEK